MPDINDGDKFLYESTSSSSILHFFVRTSFRTLVLHAHPHETVESLIARIAATAKLPESELRIIYGSRQLPRDCTLANCGVENNASLQLLCRLRSTTFSGSWQVINEILSSVNSLLSAHMHLECNIENLVKKFMAMTPTDRDADTTEHLEVFIISGAHVALGRLYLSPLGINRELAASAVRMILNCHSKYLPLDKQRHYVPILLEFCKLLAGIAGKKCSLYLECRETLGLLLNSEGWIPFRRSKLRNLASEFYPFVVELAERIIVGLSSDNMLIASSDVVQFSYFLRALRGEILDSLGGPCSIPRKMYEGEDGSWIACLYKMFMKLLDKLDKSLEKIGNSVVKDAVVQVESLWKPWSNILSVVSESRKFAKIHENGSKLFHMFLSTRRVPLNALIRHAKRNNKYLWLLKHKDIIDSEARRNLLMMFFPDENDSYEGLYEMLIDRSQLLTESFRYIGEVRASSLHGGLFMEFKNEEATGPGVLREWLCLLCQEIFSPKNVLFLPCPNDWRRFFPNPASIVDPLHLKYFRFTGRVIALALMHKIPVGLTFDRVFFLQLSGQTITLEDIQGADPFLYRSCKMVLEMDDEIMDSDALGLSFVREIEVAGSRRTVELCPGGREIAVNSRNRKEFVTLLVNNCFITSISEQIHQFGLGFSDILSDTKFGKLFFQTLNIEEFDLILGGSYDAINVEEWKAHTEYIGYEANDHQIIYFWKIVELMQEVQKRILLSFWTSVRYLPAEGFRGLGSRLYICKAFNSQDRLPTSQTCFYQLHFPPYSSISIMYDRLNLITQEHVSYTFGFC